jgi:hypothetical protein
VPGNPARREIKDLRVVDDAGREWRVYDYVVYAGKAQRRPIGTGAAHRGFVPTDGGARRTYLMLSDENTLTPTRELLLVQLAKSRLHFRDDPAWCAQAGRAVERSDPSP